MYRRLGYCFSALDLYERFNAASELKIKKALVQSKYGVNSKKRICASVLIYCFYLIIMDIIENNITFVLPLKQNRKAFIELKEITGDALKQARQKGALGEIDLLATNFVGYHLAYRFENSRKAQSKKWVYVSSEYKKILTNNINKGKLKGCKLTYVEDYYNAVKDRFPDLEIWEIEKILLHGFRAFYWINRAGGDVKIFGGPTGFSVYVGQLFTDKDLSIKYYKLKYSTKYRIIYNATHKVWDSKYYFGLTEDEYMKYMSNKKGRLKTKITFDSIVFFKIKEECFLHNAYNYFYEIEDNLDRSFCIKRENYTTRNFKLVAKRDKDRKIIEV